ncbi:MAG: serine/threonine-protein kinase, partial [Planctomycetia bacterium]
MKTPLGADTLGRMKSDGSTSASGDGDLSGRRLGGYRLVRRLGSGAMADVYLAEQESLARQVAVKVLRPDTVRQATAVQRFAQEARAAAGLVHGHIVQIHEVACVDGVHFLAEEYVAGPTLKAWLTVRGPLDARQAVAVLGQVGSALVRAAEQGVVHRDIKPENLLVTPAGDVKVADFGLARVLAGPEGMDLTQDGMTLGTPLYMSPEQAEGRPVDTRSDLYSLGATIYHLLAGRPPFDGATPLAVAMAHINQPATPIATLRPDLPAGLCEIVNTLLAKQPAERYASPTDLLHAVAEIEAAVAPGSRHRPSALAWSDPAEWAGAVSVAPIGQATSAARPHTRTLEMREATMRLQSLIEREAVEVDSTRRLWIATGVAALAALAA